MGDVRGHGIGAFGTVAAVLGCFREAAYDEADLGGVLRRLERALDRHLRREHPASVAEEFVTLLLVEIRADGEMAALNCGHPWPYRLSGTRVEQLAPADPYPPLGVPRRTRSRQPTSDTTVTGPMAGDAVRPATECRAGSWADGGSGPPHCTRGSRRPGRPLARHFSQPAGDSARQCAHRADSSTPFTPRVKAEPLIWPHRATGGPTCSPTLCSTRSWTKPGSRTRGWPHTSTRRDGRGACP
ncbi:PP2C family protein-serine/threonine phosphatase [Streptomyces purpurascens]